MKLKKELSEHEFKGLPIHLRNRYTQEWQVLISKKWYETASPLIQVARGYEVRNRYRLIK